MIEFIFPFIIKAQILTQKIEHSVTIMECAHPAYNVDSTDEIRIDGIVIGLNIVPEKEVGISCYSEGTQKIKIIHRR